MKIASHSVFTAAAMLLIVGGGVFGAFVKEFQPLFTAYVGALVALAGAAHINNISSSWLNSSNGAANANTISVP